MDEVTLVTSLYRAILSREPDPEGLTGHVSALRNGLTSERLVSRFLQSAEFKAKQSRVGTAHPLDEAPPMDVDLDLTVEQQSELWAHVARSWANLGTSEPYWSVLTDPRWKASKMTRAEILNAFYETGRANIARLGKWLARSGVLLPAGGVCAEYGCGVGRCTIWLARRCAHVVAFDISEPHLRLAKERAAAEGLTNIDFVKVTTENDLSALNGIDFFYSIVVLQHNPPPLMISILRKVFEGIKEEGVVYFQIPTYASGYSFRYNEYLRRLRTSGMEMHFVPQHAVFELAWTHGLRPLEVSPDNMIGNAGRWVSTSFLMAKDLQGMLRKYKFSEVATQVAGSST